MEKQENISLLLISDGQGASCAGGVSEKNARVVLPCALWGSGGALTPGPPFWDNAGPAGALSAAPRTLPGGPSACAGQGRGGGGGAVATRLHHPHSELPNLLSLLPSRSKPSETLFLLCSPFREVRDAPTSSILCEYRCRGAGRACCVRRPVASGVSVHPFNSSVLK